jgi:predicted transcriptional regulator
MTASKPDIIRLLASGMTTKKVAETLGISQRTVQRYARKHPQQQPHEPQSHEPQPEMVELQEDWSLAAEGLMLLHRQIHGRVIRLAESQLSRLERESDLSLRELEMCSRILSRHTELRSSELHRLTELRMKVAKVKNDIDIRSQQLLPRETYEALINKWKEVVATEVGSEALERISRRYAQEMVGY